LTVPGVPRSVSSVPVNKATLPLAGLVAAAVLAPCTRADVEAHLLVTQINGGCATVDGDGVFGGDPERYPSAAIFDAASSSVFNACANGCAGDLNPATLDGRRLQSCSYSTGCGVFNFADLHVEKIIPNNSGAYFYFGLWDDDTDPDDSLGDHWLSSATPISTTVNNNNSSPYYADNPIGTVCADVEFIGAANNYGVSYQIWFEDTTGPAAPSNVVHLDDGLSTFWDNDTRLDLQWTSGTDPNSGIAGHTGTLWSDATSSYVFLNQAAPPTSMSICPSGCTATFTPTHGNTYQFQVRATNGSYPTLSNQSAAWSSWIQFGVDLANPTSAIGSPAAGAWYATDLTVQATDTDSGSGVATCERQVLSNSSVTSAWAARACNDAFSVTVGPAGNCRHLGANSCRVDVRSTDQSRRTSSIVVRTFGIDWDGDAIASIEGLTAPGGDPILVGAWTADNTPAVEVTPGTQLSPLAGYSWTLGFPPDCVVDQGPANPLSIQLATQPEGTASFQVRTIDGANNCGPVATFTFSIDTIAETITGIAATGAGGTPVLFSGVWHRESAVEMSWTASASTAPLSFSTSTGLATPDCVADGVDPSLTLSPLPEGTTTFRVRPIDAAGNCGAAATFDLAVDTQAETTTGLAAFTESGGASIAAATWTSDNDPFITWDAATSTSPIVGYSIALDTDPDCIAEVVNPSYQFPDGIPNGTHTLNVLAIDQAGNCGFVASFELWVDAPIGAGPGRITGQLTLSRSPVPGHLDLAWGPTCGVASDYTVHEGVLGSWYSHVPVACSTSGALSITIAPGAGDRYYLVVPSTLTLEGSYGANSTGAERPASTGACLPQAEPVPCP
jgi:hypothetical protein